MHKTRANLVILSTDRAGVYLIGHYKCVHKPVHVNVEALNTRPSAGAGFACHV